MACVQIPVEDAPDWQCCPNCGSYDLVVEGQDFEGWEAWQEVYCRTCSMSWYEVYKRSHRELDKDESEEQ